MSIFTQKTSNDNQESSAQPKAMPGYEVLTFKLPWSAIEAQFSKAVNKLSQTQPIQGFRSGHVPMDVARQKYGDQLLMAEAYDLAVPEFYAKTVVDSNIDAVGQPQLDFEPQPAWGVDVMVTATVPVLPKIKMPDLAKLKVTPDKAEVRDEDVTKVLEQLAERYASEASVDRPAKDGDLVELDYEVTMQGVLIEGGSGKGHKTVLGKKHLLPDIENAVVGMKAGEEKIQKVNFEESYPIKMVAGKTADCKILLKQVWARQLPELNDEFAARLGPFTKLTEVTERIKADMLAEAEQEAAGKTEREVLETVIKAAEFGVFPDVLITREVSQLIHELEHNLEHQGVTLDDYLVHIHKKRSDLMLDFAQPATDRLKVSILLKEIIKEQKFDITPEEIAAEVRRLEGYVKDKDYLSRPEVREQIKIDIAQRKAAEWLIKKIAVSA